jgi:hypothetical protein
LLWISRDVHARFLFRHRHADRAVVFLGTLAASACFSDSARPKFFLDSRAAAVLCSDIVHPKARRANLSLRLLAAAATAFAPYEGLLRLENHAAGYWFSF